MMDFTHPISLEDCNADNNQWVTYIEYDTGTKEPPHGVVINTVPVKNYAGIEDQRRHRIICKATGLSRHEAEIIAMELKEFPMIHGNIFEVKKMAIANLRHVCANPLEGY